MIMFSVRAQASNIVNNYIFSNHLVPATETFQLGKIYDQDPSRNGGLSMTYAGGKPSIVIIHEVGVEGGTIQGSIDYMVSTQDNAFVHAFADANQVIGIANTDLKSWGSGPYGNKYGIQIESMRVNSQNDFAKELNNMASWTADQLIKYQLGAPKLVSTSSTAVDGNLASHNNISYKWGGTDHVDPNDYWADRAGRYFGTSYTMSDFRDLVQYYYDLRSVVEAKPGTVVISNGLYVLKSGNRALDITGGGVTNATRVQSYAANGTAAQTWLLTRLSDGFYTLQNPQSGKYLDVTNGATVNTTPIQIYDGNGTKAQEWAIYQNSSGGYSLISRASSRALDISGNSQTNGASIQIFDSNNTAAQGWTFTPTTYATPIADGTYVIKNISSNLVLDVAGGQTANTTNVQVYSMNNTAAQNWKFTKLADGNYSIVNPRSNRSLDLAGGGMADCTNIQIYDQNGTRAQEWIVTKNADHYEIRSAASGKAVDIYGGVLRNGSNVEAYTANQTNAQAWQLLSAPSSTVSSNQALAPTPIAPQTSPNVTSSFTLTGVSTSQKAWLTTISSQAVSLGKANDLFPSVILAQAIGESGWGGSDLAKNANNLFGIKADSSWTGAVYSTTTQELVNGATVTVTANFRKYASQADSLKDYVTKLQTTKLGTGLRYANVFRSVSKTYATACQNLQNDGYSTSSTYATDLIARIQKYNLQAADN